MPKQSTCVFLGMHKGRVIQSTGSWYKVKTEVRVIESRLPGKFRLEEKEVTNPIAVGDWVDISMNDDNTGTIKKIHDRKNYITRKATHGRRGEHILVSNLDTAFVVQSIKQPNFELRMNLFEEKEGRRKELPQTPRTFVSAY